MGRLKGLDLNIEKIELSANYRMNQLVTVPSGCRPVTN